jgi:hypothetical protein
MARLDSFQDLDKEIEELRKEKPEEFKDWIPTGCVVEICQILQEMVFERNGPKVWGQVRVKIRRALNKYDLERTRIKCDRDNNNPDNGRINLEIHRPAADDDDYMKFALRGVRRR